MQDGPGVLGTIGTVLGEFRVNIRSVQMEPIDDALVIRLLVRTPGQLNFPEVTRRLASCEGVSLVEWTGIGGSLSSRAT